MARCLRALAAVAVLWLLESRSGDSQLPLIPAWGLCASVLCSTPFLHVHTCTHIHTQSWLKRNVKKWVSSRIQRKDISNPGLVSFHIVLRKEGQPEDQVRWVMACPTQWCAQRRWNCGSQEYQHRCPWAASGSVYEEFSYGCFLSFRKYVYT